MAKGRKTGGGSRKGKPNAGTQDLRDMILLALDRSGGVEYLEARAKDTPTAFLTLIGKTLPQTVNANVNFDVAGAVAAAEERLRARGISV